jgi:hypothetical protein
VLNLHGGQACGDGVVGSPKQNYMDHLKVRTLAMTSSNETLNKHPGTRILGEAYWKDSNGRCSTPWIPTAMRINSGTMATIMSPSSTKIFSVRMYLPPTRSNITVMA